MTEPEKQQPAPVENILLLRREDFDELLTHAAERGAERVLTHLGLENGHAARGLCCITPLRSELPQTPDGFMPRARSPAYRAA